MPPGPDLADAVRSYALPAEENPFAELFSSVDWEDVGKGRLGAVLTRPDETGGVPLVRTTTRYDRPAQRFRAVHERLARRIQEAAGLPTTLDNALIESYTNAYSKMGAHSDQALDLAEGSFIAVFSCYEHPEAGPPRKLIVEPKADGGSEPGPHTIPLAHNTVLVFSVETNRRLRHRIVLDTPDRSVENRWLGVTYRTSKTRVRFRDGHPHLPGATRLTRADEEQRREFYALRRRENRETDFAYPELTYTISDSDLLPPV
ncbi:alpha-ketoglutarate-dependent dioxygenase AlkB [Streptomyces sp. NPDC050145]|uniref:alpha-ketoglutarate-dependent dioxygenase AlkB n=1 Tax=Streptomyces sp. NPDC050145 TaxID=3365602 RepID=UPI0037AC50A5